MTETETAEERRVTYPYANERNRTGADFILPGNEGGLDWARVRARYEELASPKELWLERAAVSYRGTLTGMARRAHLEELYLDAFPAEAKAAAEASS